MDRECAVQSERTDAMPKPAHNYDADFRVEAVNLLLTSGRPLKRVAAELGISDTSLRIWRDRALKKGGGAEAAGRSGAPLLDPAEEIRRLHREVVYLKRQREILKKAMGILSEEPPSGMP
jgi:transposase